MRVGDSSRRCEEIVKKKSRIAPLNAIIIMIMIMIMMMMMIIIIIISLASVSHLPVYLMDKSAWINVRAPHCSIS